MKQVSKHPKLQENPICNFRAQTIDDWVDWNWFKDWCKDQGLTTCRPLIAFIRSFRKSMEGLKEGLEQKGKRELLNAFPLIVALDQQNTFVYSVDKFRRTPKLELFLKDNFRTGTICTRMAVSYVLEKARYLLRNGQSTFCFRDFAEMKHGYFRKTIGRLRQSGEIATVEPRSCPRMYMLMYPDNGGGTL